MHGVRRELLYRQAQEMKSILHESDDTEALNKRDLRKIHGEEDYRIEEE